MTYKERIARKVYDGDKQERRVSQRFPFTGSVEFRSEQGRSGTGQMRNFSSKGLLFTASEALHPWQYVEARVDWPVLMADGTPLTCRVRGRVVRTEADGVVAMAIQSFEFCTRGNAA